MNKGSDLNSSNQEVSQRVVRLESDVSNIKKNMDNLISKQDKAEDSIKELALAIKELNIDQKASNKYMEKLFEANKEFMEKNLVDNKEFMQQNLKDNKEIIQSINKKIDVIQDKNEKKFDELEKENVNQDRKYTDDKLKLMYKIIAVFFTIFSAGMGFVLKNLSDISKLLQK